MGAIVDGAKAGAYIPESWGDTQEVELLAADAPGGPWVGMVVGEAALAVYTAALATVGSVKQARGVVVAIGEQLDNTNYKVEIARQAVISGYVDSTPAAGGTVDGEVYVAEAALKGEITETIPTTSGDADTVVGYVASPGVVRFDIGFPHIADTTVT